MSYTNIKSIFIDSDNNDLGQISVGLNTNYQTDFLVEPEEESIDENASMVENSQANILLNVNASLYVLPDSDKSRIANADFNIGAGLPITGNTGVARQFHVNFGYGLTTTNRQRKSDDTPGDHDGILLRADVDALALRSPGNYSQGRFFGQLETAYLTSGLLEIGLNVGYTADSYYTNFDGQNITMSHAGPYLGCLLNLFPGENQLGIVHFQYKHGISDSPYINYHLNAEYDPANEAKPFLDKLYISGYSDITMFPSGSVYNNKTAQANIFGLGAEIGYRW